MYQNCYYDRRTNTVHIWDDEKGHLQYDYKQYAYIKSPNGNFTALDGTKVTKVFSLKDNGAKLYESDIDPDTRYLIDLYLDSDKASINHRVAIIDIEVDSTHKFPEPKTADNTITAIAIYDKANKHTHCLILDANGSVSDQSNNGTTIYSYKTEFELLQSFLAIYININPTIVTGWNIQSFDIPYLYNRIKRVLDNASANLLSPINIVNYNKHESIYEIAGVSSLDYMLLYKRFCPNEEPSYSLDAISMKELGKGKLQYEGSLQTLYDTDITKFIDYNINDVVLVNELDDKLQYIELTKNLCHKGHTTYDSVYASSKYLDGAILTYLKRLNIVAPDRPAREEIINNTDDDDDELTDSGGSFEGAYVKPPIPGRYTNLIVFDYQSLYPSVIRTLNISPETKIGKVQEYNKADVLDLSFTNILSDTVEFMDLNGRIKKYSKDEFTSFILDNKYSIGSNGAVYKTSHVGLMPAILESWFNERLEYKALADKYSKEGNKQLEEYFDGMQYAIKILLNSMYGVLGLKVFRFYDLDNAECVTTTGKGALRFAEMMSNKFFTTKTGIDSDRVIYEDTDSIYILAAELSDGSIEQTKLIVDEIYALMSTYLPKYCITALNTTTCHLNLKPESIIQSAFWRAKKRYAYKKIYDLEKNKPVDKLVIKGLDVVRSNFPKVFRSFMKEILLDILDNVPQDQINTKIFDIRERMPQFNIDDISKPTSVKNLVKYKSNGLDFVKGVPVHVKAALSYNFLLDHYGYTGKIKPIVDGSKVKWIYLRDNPFNIPAIAYKGYEDPKEILDFISANVDYEKNFKSNLQKKLQAFYDSLSWGNIPELNNKIVNTFFDW